MRILSLFCLVLVLSFLPACSAGYQLAPYEKGLKGMVFNKSVPASILASAKDLTVLHSLKNEIGELFDEMDALASPYNSSSECSRFNRSENGLSYDSGKLRFLYLRSRYYSRLTEGLFDPTIYPLLEYWRNCEKNQTEPNKEKINEILKSVGINKIEFSKAGLKKTVPGIKVDFGAIAKGMAIDLCAGLLKKKGIENFIVNVGDDLYVGGLKKGGKKWRVAIKNPLKPGKLYTAIDVSNKGVATSGNQYQFLSIKGRKYYHIINPLTGWPIDTRILSCTVIAQTAEEADALATSLCLLGRKKGLALIEKTKGAEALILFLETADSKSISNDYSKGFPAYVSKE